ncbi:AAA family ATPase, partial [Aeromonas veronii]|uniref:AAA family ATPase n=1 Tax=Aeromonas veronii TaxID=654 RepID=UPI003D1F9AFB
KRVIDQNGRSPSSFEKAKIRCGMTDEASMIDLPTMYRLTNHLHPTVRIIFTGDPNQLPPIGCGKVLNN